MKNFFTNKRIPGGWLLPVWCTVLMLIGQLAMAQRSVTYTTEPLSAADAPVGTSKHLIYKMKVVVGNQGGVTVGPVAIKTTGTYTSADISGFTLWYNTTNGNLADAQLFESAASLNGAGEMLEFRGRLIGLASPSTVYFFLTADVRLTATGGHTFGINGATDPLNIGYYYDLPVVNNQQTNAAGLQTIVVPKVTYSTEIVPAGSATREEVGHLLYTFKVEVGPLEIEIVDVNIKTTGTYTAADISSFSLKRGNSYYGPSNGTVTGNGETLSWRLPRSVLPANSVFYFEVRANITSTATEGRTFGIDGSAKPLQISYRSRTPTVTDNQTNVSGLQTIVVPKVTYTTQAVPATSVLQGTSDKLLYILKVVVGPESPVKLRSIALQTKGNYTTSEISEFKIWQNSSPSLTGAAVSGTVGAVTSAGETLSMFFLQGDLAANSTTYLLVSANVKPDAAAGKTVGINGTGAALDISYYKPIPVATNNSQSDAGGLQTIVAPTVTYTTETVPAANVLQGTVDRSVYILKVVVGPAAPVILSSVSIKTSGTYATSDISQFAIWRNTVPSKTGASYWGADASLTGAGETLNLGGAAQTLAAGSTTYFLVNADVKPGAAAGKTFGITGASNALNITYTSPPPTITNNQSDVAGLLTIVAPTVTYSTESVPAANVLQSTVDRSVYILKVVVGPAAPVILSSVSIKTSGTYATSDISQFAIWRNTAPSNTGASYWGVDASINGGGETLNLGGAAQTLAAGSTTYFLVNADVKPGAMAGKTFGINGTSSALNITYTSPPPTITNNQSDAAGLQTIIAQPTVTYSMESVPAANAWQGTVNHLLYILKIQVGSVAPVTLNSMSIATSGNYTATDISQFKLWQHSTASLAMATQIGTQGTVSATGTGETLSFGLTALALAANSTTYFFLSADIQPTATAGKRIGINGGASSTLNITYKNTTPTIINQNADVAKWQTIAAPTVTYSTEKTAASNAPPAATNHPFYVLKVVMGNGQGATLTNFNVTTNGNYAAGDISSFSLYQSDTPTVNAGAVNGRVLGSVIGSDNTSTGAGETLIFNTGNIPLASGSTTYLIVMANIAPAGTLNKTFHINGATNPATLTFSGSSPSITNNQTNEAGIQTISTAPLPVTLVSFNARAEGNVRQLSWATTMEKDNDYFAVQRSLDAKNFTEIARVKGIAAGFQTHRYNYTDTETVPAGTMLYYRLKMVDLDGSYAYSSIASCQDGNLQTLQATVFPNPFSEYVKVKFIPGETVTFQWVSMDGRSVGTVEKRVIPSSGESLITGLDKLLPGIYLLTIRSVAGEVVQKVVRE